MGPAPAICSQNKLPLKDIFKGVRQLYINTPQTMQVSVRKKGWIDEEGRFHLQIVCLDKELFEWVTQTWFWEYEMRFERLFCCYGCHVTEYVLLSTYANFRCLLFYDSWLVFQKQYSFLIHRNKGVDSMQSLLHLRLKSSDRGGFVPWSFDGPQGLF